MRRILLAALLVAGCGNRESGLAGSTTTYLSGAAQLSTEFWKRAGSDRREALIHVLWVPEFDIPASKGHFLGGVSGGTRSLRQFDYDYEDDDRKVQAERVTVRDNEFVQGGGRTYPLSRGNVFLAQVSDQGKVRLTQIPSTLTAADPAQVLAAIQNAVDDARVDAIRLKT